MDRPSAPAFLDEILRTVRRRYRLPPSSDLGVPPQAGTAAALALAVEHARAALSLGQAPGAVPKRRFLEALARMIRDAMRPGHGDPAFQAMVLRHRASRVREYASLSAHAGRDRRALRAAVNAMAHPARQQRIPQEGLRRALARLHALASSADWHGLELAARRIADMPEAEETPPLAASVARLLQDPALGRLQRLDALASDGLVRQYQALWQRHGPPSGSPDAARQGSVAQQRGAAVEAAAAQALEALARRLDGSGGTGQAHRVVTSMRVPASIPGSAERAKTEWDAVLLRRAPGDHETGAWDVCLLVEAKASVDAATTDLPRLQRGLRLLAHADPQACYPFETRQGTVTLRGASLSTLAVDEAGLAGTVLYCCDAPVDGTPRLLGAASRMQLLSAPASLAFACRLAEGRDADPGQLEAVWNALLESPRWAGVLNQYPMLRQVRELMVHPEDLMGMLGEGTAAGLPA